MYDLHYHCPECGAHWIGTLHRDVPDDCPECGAENIDPQNVTPEAEPIHARFGSLTVTAMQAVWAKRLAERATVPAATEDYSRPCDTALRLRAEIVEDDSARIEHRARRHAHLSAKFGTP